MISASAESIFFSFIIFKISVLYKTLVGDLKILYISNQQIKNIRYEKSKEIKKKSAGTHQRR